jgi:uncharacterized membrane protein (DUF373 family)
METLLFALAVLAAGLIYRSFSDQLQQLREVVKRQAEEQARLALEVERLRQAQHLPSPVTAADLPTAVLATSPVAAPTPPRPVPAPNPAAPIPPAPGSQPAPAPNMPPRPLPAPTAPRPQPATVLATTASPAQATVLAPLPLLPAEPAAPSWWQTTAALLLENWTGILGAIILVTGVGFLGIYAALRVSPFARFWLISGGAGALLALRWGLRRQAFAVQLSEWLQSSAAAIFLFACVGAASLPGLQWASGALAYALLLSGVAANLWLAWTAGRETVASLHAVLSLVALAVLPPSLLTLGAAVSVTVFSIFITYRQQWRFQLLLSIISFLAFHLYWHAQHPALTPTEHIGALLLVLLVGLAGAVVQYRRIYATRGFEPVLFSAHLLNWTCLALNLYLHSTGSVWKTIPLGLGAAATFWAGRRARGLGLEWLFRTDTIISLILALAAAFSLLAWHATPAVVLLFMLLETLLVAHVMARETEPLVFQVALSGAGLAGVGLLAITLAQTATAAAPELYRLAVVLALAGGLGITFSRLTAPLVRSPQQPDRVVSGEVVFPLFSGLSLALLAGSSTVLAVALFGRPQPPVAGLLVALLAGAGLAFGLASWLGRQFTLPWLRPTLLLLGEAGLALAILGLHKAGLSWAGAILLLYLENQAFSLFLLKRDELIAAGHRSAGLFLGGLTLAIIVTNAGLLPGLRPALLVAAAAATALGQLLRHPNAAAAAALSANRQWTERSFGWLMGALLLAAGSWVNPQSGWQGWAALAVGAGFLLLHRLGRTLGLAEGVFAATLGFSLLRWGEAGWSTQPAPWLVVGGCLLPAMLLSLVGMLTCYSARLGRFRRWPWLYLLGVQLAGLAWLVSHSAASVTLLWLLLAIAAFGTALYLRQRLAGRTSSAELPATLVYHGQPDRHLLHLSYLLLGSALLLHLAVVLPGSAQLWHLPARYLTAAALLLTFGGLLQLPAPSAEPRYASWHYLHPWLLEAALGLAAITVGHELRAAWPPLVAVAAALLAEALGSRLPPALARLRAYGRLLYALAAVGAALVSLSRLSPGLLLTPDWWAAALTVAALFAYAALALRDGPSTSAPQAVFWPPGLAELGPLLLPPFSALVGLLLYPAFGALALLLGRSFDKSLLTVLLMLEVFGVFIASLALRRADLRYAALLGMAACLVRLVFFDLSQQQTLTRAIVFIFMGLLLLGMNALYARFRSRATDAPLSPTAELATDAETLVNRQSEGSAL